jgi:hypothetical protein
MWGGFLSLLISIASLPLLRSRHSIPPLSKRHIMDARCPPKTIRNFSQCSMVENLHAPMVATMLSNAFSFQMFFSVYWKNF